MPLTDLNVRNAVVRSIQPGNFYVGPGIRLEWRYDSDELTHWEIYRGQALDQGKTRAQVRFETWSIIDLAHKDESDEPLIAVRYNQGNQQVFVTRSIRCFVWESQSEGNLVTAREAIRRVRELVATINVLDFDNVAEFEDELSFQLHAAIIGTSRLPITSLESPLPEFSLGQLGYARRVERRNEPMRDPLLWFDGACENNFDVASRSQALEFVLRATGKDAIRMLAHSPQIVEFDQLQDLTEILLEMFNGVSLSPYTDFVDKTIAFVDELVQTKRLTKAAEIDFWARLVRRICRHLTGYDLTNFHHLGANYPDALALEEIIGRLILSFEDGGTLFIDADDDTPEARLAKRLRRRAIRQAWVVGEQYRGHLVPDRPTTTGENRRVLPNPHSRLPEEQIHSTRHRTRRLFADRPLLDVNDPSTRSIIDASLADLNHAAERLELGRGIFLDRPLGFAKARGEPDATLLFSQLAFSLSIAKRRIEMMRGTVELPDVDMESVAKGMEWTSTIPHQRPGVLSIQDSQNSASDWRFLRTTKLAISDLLSQYRFDADAPIGLRILLESQHCLIVPSMSKSDELDVFDGDYNRRGTLRMDAAAGYVSRRGSEYLRNGFASTYDSISFRIEPRLS